MNSKFMNNLLILATMLSCIGAVGNAYATPIRDNVTKMGGVWVQGIFNHSKHSRTADNEGFRANTRGILVGLEDKLSDAMTVGFGYGYTTTDINKQNMDIRAHHVFLYGHYQPDAWYANWLLGYGYNGYEESTPLGSVKNTAKYDINSYTAHLLTGYQFKSGFAPEVGFRYLISDQESYSDGVNRIGSDRNEVLTGVAGIRYEQAFQMGNAILTPYANLAVGYDFMSDRSSTNVQIAGGVDYRVQGRRLHRFGVEPSAGISLTLNSWEFSADYLGDLRKDFQNHSAMLRVKYSF